MMTYKCDTCDFEFDIKKVKGKGTFIAICGCGKSRIEIGKGVGIVLSGNMSRIYTDKDLEFYNEQARLELNNDVILPF